jgi:integrase
MKRLSGLRLQNGKRKYLNADERTRFLRAADDHEADVRTFRGILAFAGCPISEALELTADRIDLANGVLVFETLKKRRRGVFRAAPVPPALLDTMNLVHGVRKLQARHDGGLEPYLWPRSRTGAGRRICEVMDDAACMRARRGCGMGRATR